jgi:hypothetical protein
MLREEGAVRKDDVVEDESVRSRALAFLVTGL